MKNPRILILLALFFFGSGQLTLVVAQRAAMQTANELDQDCTTKDDPADLKPNLIVRVGKNCPPCTRWLREILPQLAKSPGWRILVLGAEEGDAVPQFEFGEDRRYQHVGFLTIDEIDQIIKTEFDQ